MPIYEYRCLDCGSHLEKMQKVSDAPLTICEKCGGKLEKQWSLSGFQFKGGGWYVTDYSGKTTDKGAEKKPEKTSAGESTSKSEPASNISQTKEKSEKTDSKTD